MGLHGGFRRRLMTDATILSLPRTRVLPFDGASAVRGAVVLSASQRARRAAVAKAEGVVSSGAATHDGEWWQAPLGIPSGGGLQTGRRRRGLTAGRAQAKSWRRWFQARLLASLRASGLLCRPRPTPPQQLHTHGPRRLHSLCLYLCLCPSVRAASRAPGLPRLCAPKHPTSAPAIRGARQDRPTRRALSRSPAIEKSPHHCAPTAARAGLAFPRRLPSVCISHAHEPDARARLIATHRSDASRESPSALAAGKP